MGSHSPCHWYMDKYRIDEELVDEEEEEEEELYLPLETRKRDERGASPILCNLACILAMISASVG